MSIPPPGHFYEFGDFRFEVESQRLFKQGELVALPPKAAALLHLFLQRNGAVLKKEEIYDRLWGEELVEESNLTRTIYLLRKTLNQSDSPTQFIETLPKIGYRFFAEVREISPAIHPVAEKAFAFPAQNFSVSQIPVEPPLMRQTAIEPQILPMHPASEPLVVSETAWGIFFRRVQVEPLKATAEFAPKVLQNRRMKIATLTILPALIVCLAALIAVRLSSPVEIKVQSLAVLPFSELGVDNRESMQGLGVADTVISRLGSLENVEVRPTSAVRPYLEKLTDPLEAGRELKVEAVLTGNIQRQNGNVRVTAQLLRISDGKTLWSGTFDEAASEIFTLQDKLTDTLVAKLNLPVTEEKREQLKKHGTQSVAAYNRYLQGRLFWNRRTPEWIQKAIVEFEEATKLDPNYAQAYAGLADSYALTSSGLPALERMPKAKAAAEKALELDNQLAEARASLGFIKYKFDGDWTGAEESLRRSIQLNPNYATAHQWLGELLAIVGQFDEALAAANQAERLDPLSLPIKEDVGLVYYRWRQYDKAEAKIKEVLEIDPRFTRARGRLISLYQLQGRFDEAIAERLKISEISGKPPEYIAALKQSYQKNGWNGFWRKYLELCEPSEEDAFGKAVISLRFGDKEQALDWLEKSFEERGTASARIKTDPQLDPLRDEPRFQMLLRRARHIL
ncbi:MAG: winged helix-turn-helix domain-containing protein [Acidobacteriota bacterium]|nr:winged helix-turn-helix domain-containing protein [Acidobacteriota bacterium]